MLSCNFQKLDLPLRADKKLRNKFLRHEGTYLGIKYMKKILSIPFIIRGFILFVVATTLALTSGCGSENAFSDSNAKLENATLVVKNEQEFMAGLNMGTSLTIEAEVYINGKQVEAPSWTVSSEDESIAKIDKTLNVIAVSPGETYVNIKHKDLTGRLKVVVTNAYIESVHVTPSNVSVISGYTASLSSSATLDNGRTVALDNELLTWTSSNPEIATVNNQGVVEGLDVGSVTVTASLISEPSKTSSSSITVLEAVIDSIQVTPPTISLIDGLTETLAVSATLSDGRAMSLDNQLVTWTSSDIATATVNNQGIVEGQDAGNATITATLINNPSKTSSSSVTVSEAVVNSIQVTPSTVSLVDGHTTPLTASAILSDGRTVKLDSQLVTWTSSDVTTAVVNNQGIVAGENEGTTTVTATLISDTSKTSSSVVTVSEAIIESIQATPSTVSLIDGHTTTLTASATLSDGRMVPLDNHLVTWTSEDTATAIVNNQGIVEGQEAGTATVTATLISDTSKTSSSTVTVTAAVIESIEVTPSPLSLNIAGTKTLSVSATLSDGRVTPLDNSALTWSSTDPSIITVTSDGVVQAIASGITSINASYTDLSAVQVEVTVLPNIKQISLNPERALVDTNGQFQFEVKALLEDDSLVTLDNKLITWSVDDSSVALVDSDGIAQGVSDGSTRVSATYLYLSDTSDIIVSNLVKETQSSVNVAVGVPFQWRAIYSNTNNDRIDITKQATWSTYYDTGNGQNKAHELAKLETKGQYRVDKLGTDNGYSSDIVYTYNGDMTRVAVTGYTSDNISSLPECSTKQAGDLGMCRTKRIGGNGGGPKPIASCPLGSVATGLVLKHTTMGWGALGLQLKCSSVSLDLNNQLVFQDNDKESALVHGGDHPRNTTGTYTSQCPVGSIISSIRASAAANSYRTLDDVQLGCSPLSYDTYNSRYVVDKANEQLLPWLHSNPTDVMVTEFENNVGLSAISVKAGSALDSTVFIASDLSMSVTTQ